MNGALQLRQTLHRAVALRRPGGAAAHRRWSRWHRGRGRGGDGLGAARVTRQEAAYRLSHRPGRAHVAQL